MSLTGTQRDALQYAAQCIRFRASVFSDLDLCGTEKLALADYTARMLAALSEIATDSVQVKESWTPRMGERVEVRTPNELAIIFGDVVWTNVASKTALVAIRNDEGCLEERVEKWEHLRPARETQ